jgi:hypothetical protein
MKRLDAQWRQCDLRVEEQRAIYVAAQTEVGKLELKVGPEQAAWLGERLTPAQLDPKFEKAVEDAPEILDAAKNLNEMVRGGEELAHGADSGLKVLMFAAALQAQSHCPPGLEPHEIQNSASFVAQQIQPAGQEQEQKSKDLLEGVQGTRRPSRSDQEQERDNINRAINPDQSAPSKGAPGTMEELQALEKVHRKELQDLKDEFKEEQKIFDARHERLNTEPELVKGYQAFLNEKQEARWGANVERQADERKDLIQNGPRDRTKVIEGREDFF